MENLKLLMKARANRSPDPQARFWPGHRRGTTHRIEFGSRGPLYLNGPSPNRTADPQP